ncbi:unnamed protein product [Vitrella brassicaformis CCMP3155]|uniref:Uncharacterized protein n=1 Tax=Vitrella brassicaformis (strain CCMP3155) TaxID=1169540 RepID=A0A0G4G1F9_VITBC|nr:unnamed protein product [Vitrella brassicaformis CCMP3155]|eukprot:CEM21843.1 unnamed protein product [Vitrella brassicaformis CCMP3155]
MPRPSAPSQSHFSERIRQLVKKLEDDGHEVRDLTVEQLIEKMCDIEQQKAQAALEKELQDSRKVWEERLKSNTNSNQQR